MSSKYHCKKFGTEDCHEGCESWFWCWADGLDPVDIDDINYDNQPTPIEILAKRFKDQEIEIEDE